MWIVILLWLAALLLSCSLLVEISVSVGRPTRISRCLRLSVFGGYARPFPLGRSSAGESRREKEVALRRALTKALLEELSWQRPQLVRDRRSLALYLRAKISGARFLVLTARMLYQQLRSSRSFVPAGKKSAAKKRNII